MNRRNETRATDLTDRNESLAIRREVSKHSRRLQAAAGRSWRSIDDGLSDAEILRAARARVLPGEWLRNTREAYRDSADSIADIWTEAQMSGSLPVKRTVRGLGIDHDWTSFDEGLDLWSLGRSDRWVSIMTDAQERSFSTAFDLGGDLSDRDLAFMLRESVGLTPRQVSTLFKARSEIISQDPNAPRARIESALGRQSSALKRTRRQRIARVEVAESFNRGSVAAGIEIESTGQLSGPVFKVWRTQPDERTCPICQPLDGARALLSGVFGGETLGSAIESPPAHLGCRCVVTLEID